MEEAQSRHDAIMSFREHLRELRRRLVRIAIAFIIGILVTWELRYVLFDFLSYPITSALADHGITHFQVLSITESIMVFIKTTFIADFFLLSPYIFWELWSFISPGLYAKERRFIFPLSLLSVLLFLLGATFAYAVLLPYLTDWLIGMTLESGQILPQITLENAYSFSLSFLLVFGLVFQLPLILFFLSLWGIVNGRGLLRFWRYFVVLSFLISGILTPPDPISQIMMAVPMNFLYGFGVLTAFSVSRAKRREGQEIGMVAIKAMALSLGIVLAGGALLVSFIMNLGTQKLHERLPADTTFALYFDLDALSDTDAPSPELTLPASPWDDEYEEALLIGLPESPPLWLIRGPRLGHKLADLKPAQRDSLDTLHTFDRHTLLVGTAAQRDALQAAPRYRPSPEASRLWNRLRPAHPMWLYLPPESPLMPRLAGEAQNLLPSGLALALRIEPELQLSVLLPLSRDLEPARTERHERLLRIVHALNPPPPELRAYASAFDALAEELSRVVPEASQTRIGTIQRELHAELNAAQQSRPFPLLTELQGALPPFVIQPEETLIRLSTTLSTPEPPQLPQLLQLFR